MYRGNLGSLGQTVTAGTNFAPGQSVSLPFALSSTGAITLPMIGSIQVMLSAWPPFANGPFTLRSVSLDNPVAASVLTVEFNVNASGAQYTYGLLASSIADLINGTLAFGSVTPVGISAGLGTTTFGQQLEEQGGLTLSPVAPISPGQPAWETQLIKQATQDIAPAGFGSISPFVWVGLAGAVAVLALIAIK